jgi:hypothetical protein
VTCGQLDPAGATRAATPARRSRPPDPARARTRRRRDPQPRRRRPQPGRSRRTGGPDRGGAQERDRAWVAVSSSGGQVRPRCRRGADPCSVRRLAWWTRRRCETRSSGCLGTSWGHCRGVTSTALRRRICCPGLARGPQLGADLGVLASRSNDQIGHRLRAADLRARAAAGEKKTALAARPSTATRSPYTAILPPDHGRFPHGRTTSTSCARRESCPTKPPRSNATTG